MKKARGNILQNLNKYKYIYLMILPGMLFYIIFSYMPMYGIILAFKKFMYNKGIMGSPWVGLDNFKMMLKDREFARVFVNTVIISFGKIITGFPAPIIMALLINELTNRKFKKMVQSVLYFPHFLSWVIIAGLIYNLLSVTNGVLSKILEELFNIKQIAIIGNPKYFRSLLYVSSIWKSVGWGTIIYLAAIAGIDQEIYQSALIDGANRWERARYITIPSLSYSISILLILNVGQVMNAGFDQVFNLYDPGVFSVGDIIDTYVYRVGLRAARYEYSTTVGLFKSVINCGLLLSANLFAKQLGQEGIY